MINRQSSVFCLPGLGTDHRIFSRLNLNSPTENLHWLEPKPREPLTEYARRMALPLMDINSPIIIGVSFGGILALEISRFKKLGGIIIISGIKSDKEKPFSFRLMKRIPFYRLTKGSWRIRTIPLWSPTFGIRKKEEQELLKDIFSTFSDNYRMWAIHQITHWKERAKPQCPLFCLHGAKDKVFPAHKIQQATILKKGTHFMVYQMADEISPLINVKMDEWREIL